MPPSIPVMSGLQDGGLRGWPGPRPNPYHCLASARSATMTFFSSALAFPDKPREAPAHTRSFEWPNQRLLLAERVRLNRRRISLVLVSCGGFGRPPQQKRNALGGGQRNTR